MTLIVTGDELTRYQICLLMWYLGYDGERVRNGEFTQELIDLAERHAEKCGVDVEEWEKENYGEEEE